MKSSRQRSGAVTAQGERLADSVDFHRRDDDLIGVQAAVTNQLWLLPGSAQSYNQFGRKRCSFDDQIQWTRPLAN